MSPEFDALIIRIQDDLRELRKHVIERMPEAASDYVHWEMWLYLDYLQRRNKDQV